MHDLGSESEMPEDVHERLVRGAVDWGEGPRENWYLKWKLRGSWQAAAVNILLDFQKYGCRNRDTEKEGGFKAEEANQWLRIGRDLNNQLIPFCNSSSMNLKINEQLPWLIK